MGLLPIPTSGPDEGPFASPQFGAAWRPFVLGAVRHALDNRYTFEGDETDQDEIDLIIDHLVYMLSVDVPTMAAQTTFIPAHGWQPYAGIWSKSVDSVAPYDSLIFSPTPALTNILTYPISLIAGEYAVTTRHQKYSVGGNAVFTPSDAAPLVDWWFVATYNASTLRGQLALDTFILSEDFSGPLYMHIVDNAGVAGTQAVIALSDITITRIGDVP